MPAVLNGLVLLVLLGSSMASAAASRTLGWSDLQPPGEAAYNAGILAELNQKLYQAIRSRKVRDYEREAAPLRRQLRAGVVEQLDGQAVRLPGYAVPLDYASDGTSRAFLLVPFYGACLHVPAPPANQIVLVNAETPVRLDDPQQPIWVEGTLRIDHSTSSLASVSYTLALKRSSPFEGGSVPYEGPVPHADGF